MYTNTMVKHIFTCVCVFLYLYTYIDVHTAKEVSLHTVNFIATADVAGRLPCLAVAL